MPANPKYLTSSPWQRFARITAAILGGYLLTASLHLLLAKWIDKTIVIITSSFSGFIVWAVLMVLAFLFKKAWKAWSLYLGLSIVLLLLTYYGK